MASSSKQSSSKRPAPKASGNRVYGVTPAAPPSIMTDMNLDSTTRVRVYNAVRSTGDTPDDQTALFLPASAEECSVLVNNFKRFPNSAPPAFHLPQYANPDQIDFQAVLESLDPSRVAPATFYPPHYVRACSVFSEGRPSTGEGLYLYQALTILQRALAKIISGHHSKAEDRRRLLQFVGQPNFSACLRYYHSYWHYTIECPLFAPLLIALVCDFCEEHLLQEEYKKHVYNSQTRTGYGMSSKTRQRVKACLDATFSLKQLAIPIPFDPTTREGQLIITIASRGTDSDQIRQPYTGIALRPDPSKCIVAPKPSKARTVSKAASTLPVPPRPATPGVADSDSGGSSFHGASAPASPQAFPVTSSPVIELDGDVDDDPDLFLLPLDPEPPAPRRSIARAAKTKPLIPEVVMKASTTTKRERPSVPEDKEQPPAGPPPKKRRTQAASGKTRANTPAPVPVSPLPSSEAAPLRIQEGLPDYFDGDDLRTTKHQFFLTNPDFKTKTPFSQLIRKTVAQNPRNPKLPFLRPPKWNLSEEMKDFGAFINSSDTTFSLQGLSRYSYLASRPLQPATGTTLPSPEAIHSSSNCLTCLSRGVICEGGGKPGGPCSHCDRTHRNCPSCLGLDEHRDRFLAIHNTVQGYPAGYSGSLDRFRNTLDEMTHIATSFKTIFGDVRRRLALNIQEVRANGFDFNVVLSKWTEDNPNLPLDYDLLTWLATFFGWDSACNLSAFLVDPADAARLEDFLRNNTSFSTETADSPAHLPAPASLPITTPASTTSLNPLGSPPRPRRRPAAATPSNFFSDDKFHTPPASTTVEEEMEVDEGTSRASVAQALVTEYDDSDDEEDADVETDDEAPVEIAPPASLNTPKPRK
ncbi:hypothetical protein EV360DRAFT_90534 [Lentinula raphanica]|nr:hypothetical protein EV360DRAFT_90534 [Lentinula raphanica]